MNFKDIQNKYTEVSDNIDAGMLAKAFRQLSDMLNRETSANLYQRLETVRGTYSFMLHYFRQGAPDADRDKVFSSICNELHSILDEWMQRIFRKYVPNSSSNDKISDLLALYKKYRNLINLAAAEDVYAANLTSAAEDFLSRIFSIVWTTVRFSQADRTSISEALKEDAEERIDLQLGYTLLGALLLGCLQFYDRSKLQILIETFLNSSSEAFRARSIVGIVLILDRYPSRVKSDSTITALLDLMGAHPDFDAALRETMLNLIRTRDTERINRKLEDELIPEITRLKPDIEKKMKEMGPEIQEDMELNPQWEDMLQKSGLLDKMRELSEIQEHGGDLFMLAFSKMKQFPFFNDASHWFLPFDSCRTEIHEVKNYVPEALLAMMEQSTFFCDSDKYSFALGLTRMPEAQRKAVSSQLDAQLQFIKQDESTSLFKELTPSLSRYIDLYIKDLFRFYSLSASRKEYNNPFERPIRFIYLPVLGDQVRDFAPMMLLAEFYFQRGYWADASAVYAELLKLLGDAGANGENLGDSCPDEFQLLEKYGYALEKQNRFDDALRQYDAASLINDDDAWLMRRMAECYRRTGRNDDALRLYRKISEVDAENVNVALQIGRLLLENRQLDEALAQFYKVCYLTNDAPQGLRPAGWCEFLKGNYEKSLDRYERIPEEKALFGDQMCAAHNLFILGKVTEASRRYAEAFRMVGADRFASEFADDMHYLTDAGIPKADCLLMLDSMLMA